MLSFLVTPAGIRLILLSVALAAVATFVYTFFLSGDGDDGDAALAPVPVVVPAEVARTPVFAPAMTHEAAELRRVADEHARLLTSLPPTPEPTPTFTAERSQLDAAHLLANNPGGVPYPTPELENWFDSQRGLEFYREEGGDWTPREYRKSHPYRELFYYEDYPDDIPNFMDESIYVGLGRKLALGASESLAVMGSPTDTIVKTFARRVGWEVRHPELPVINVWTTFEFREGGVVSVYAVGGVMRLEVGSRVLGGDSALEYLVPGSFVGPVVVQRVATRAS